MENMASVVCVRRIRRVYVLVAHEPEEEGDKGAFLSWNSNTPDLMCEEKVRHRITLL